MKSSAALWLVLAALFAHGLSLAGGFVYDDHRFIETNTGLSDLGPRAALLEPARHTADDDRDVYRPLRALSHAYDLRRWGPDPFGFHLHSLALHLLTVLLAHACLRRMLPGDAAGAAFAGALILAVHPLGVEVVAWVSSRGDQLALAFGFAALWLAGGRRRALALGAAASCACLATLGKESAAVLPAVAWLHRRMTRRAEVAPLARGAEWALGLGVAAALGLRQLALAGVSPVQTAPHGGSLASQALWAVFGLGQTLRHLFWPTDLSVQYPQEAWAEAGPPWLQPSFVLGLGLLGLLGLLAWPRARRAAGGGVGFLLGWALLVYLPSSSLVVTLRELVNDRAAAPALAPLGALLGLLFLRETPHRRALRRGALGAVVIALALLSQRRSLEFRDDAALWSAVLRVDAHSATARYGLASARLRTGDVKGALTGLADAALHATPGSKPRAEIQTLRGELLLRVGGDAAGARPLLEEALVTQREWDAREHPSRAGDRAALLLATCLVHLGEHDAALYLLKTELSRAADPEAMEAVRRQLRGE